MSACRGIPLPPIYISNWHKCWYWYTTRICFCKYYGCSYSRDDWWRSKRPLS